MVCTMDVLTAILIILIIAVIYCLYRVWQARRLGPPADCGDYPGDILAGVCKMGVDACKELDGRDGAACRAAVGACMPVVQAAYNYEEGIGEDGGSLSLFNHIAPLIPDCAEAAYQVSPAGAARAFDSLGLPVHLPAWLARFYGDAESRANVQALADLVPDGVEWSMNFGRDLSAKGSFTPGPTQQCNPLCPRSQCYDDMDCGPAGYCQSYFADDPTYGGQCAPA